MDLALENGINPMMRNENRPARTTPQLPDPYPLSKSTRWQCHPSLSIDNGCDIFLRGFKASPSLLLCSVIDFLIRLFRIYLPNLVVYCSLLFDLG